MPCLPSWRPRYFLHLNMQEPEHGYVENNSVLMEEDESQVSLYSWATSHPTTPPQGFLICHLKWKMKWKRVKKAALKWEGIKCQTISLRGPFYAWPTILPAQKVRWGRGNIRKGGWERRGDLSPDHPRGSGQPSPVLLSLFLGPRTGGRWQAATVEAEPLPLF